MSAGRQLRRLVIAPAAVSVVAASLSVVGQTGASAASTGQSQSGTVRGIHLNHQTSTFPAAGPTASGPTKLPPGTGRQPVVDRSMSPRPTVKRTSDGGTALAGPNTSWVPTVSPTTVHSAHTGLLAGWEGLNSAQEAKTIGTLFEPPDQGLCVGNGKVLEIINNVVRVYNTNGTPATPAVGTNAFYGLPPIFDPSTGKAGPVPTDPTCAYDAGTGRFYVVMLILET